MHHSTKCMPTVECLSKIRPPKNSIITPIVSDRQVCIADGRSVVSYLE